jgi:hypothetical protein
VNEKDYAAGASSTSVRRGRIVVEVGQIWRDADGLKWKVIALKDDSAYVKPLHRPNESAILTHLARFDEWTLEPPSPPDHKEQE